MHSAVAAAWQGEFLGGSQLPVNFASGFLYLMVKWDLGRATPLSATNCRVLAKFTVTSEGARYL